MDDANLRQQWARELENIGVENVRIMLSGNVYIPNVERQFAWDWLRDKDEHRRTADQRYAGWTLVASVIAAVAGIVAAVASLLALR
jgi:hypothetical protein